jgi:hypothetical protein
LKQLREVNMHSVASAAVLSVFLRLLLKYTV